MVISEIMNYFVKKNIILFVIIGIMIVGTLFVSSKKNTTEETKKPLLITTTPETKLYRNEEWGFQFEYPEDWTFEINTFGGPNTKFNLQGNSSANDYNMLVPMFLINIVNPDFADRVINSRRKEGDIESDIVVGGIFGKKFEYNEKYSEKFSIEKISIYLSIGEYQMILAVHKTYEDVLARVLVSFKFLK